MAITGLNTTNYGGEVLETALTLAATKNELVGRGLIMVIPGVSKAMTIPRFRGKKMLQKRKEDPQKSDSKGDVEYSEKKLAPKDMMAFATFNPRAFEYIWRQYQPKGDCSANFVRGNLEAGGTGTGLPVHLWNLRRRQ